MSSDRYTTQIWQKLASGTEIRADESLLTDAVAARIGYAFAQWLATRLSTTSDHLTISGARLARFGAAAESCDHSRVDCCGLRCI